MSFIARFDNDFEIIQGWQRKGERTAESKKGERANLCLEKSAPKKKKADNLNKVADQKNEKKFK